MKMKQLFSTTLIWCAVLLMLVGCNSKSPYESTTEPPSGAVATSKPAPAYKVLETGYSGTARGAKHKLEYVFVPERKVIEPELENHELSIVIGDKIIVGKYSESMHEPYNNYLARYYDAPNRVNFAVTEAGKLDMYLPRGRESATSDETLTEEELLEIATDFMKTLIPLDEYTAEIEYLSGFSEYQITFTKIVDGYKTTDKAEVGILSNGYVSYYSACMLGMIPADTVIDVDHNAMVEAVYQKLDEIYEEVTGYDELTYDDVDTWKFMYTVLEDGSPAMLCTMNVEFCQAIGGGQSLVSGELENFLILL